MRPHHLIPALTCVLLSAAWANAEEKPLADRIAENILKLSHPRFSVREAAARDLLAIGEPALQTLKMAASSKDEEVRKRAESIVQTLNARIQNETLLRPGKLNLKYDAKPLDEAITDLAQKTGIPFVLDPKATRNPKQAITLNTGEVPYWEAIERFLSTTGLVEAYTSDVPNEQQLQPQFQDFRGGRRIINRRYGGPVQAQKAQIRLVDCSIPLAAATNMLIRVKVLPKDAPGSGITKGSNEINFVLDVTPAPSLTWQGTVNVDVRRAIDDRGVNLAQSHVRSSPTGMTEDGLINGMQFQNINGGQLILQGNGQVIINGAVTWSANSPSQVAGNWRHLPVSLLSKENASKSLRQLEGVITAQVLTPPQTLLSIDNIAKVATKSAVENGEYRLEIAERKSDKGGYVTLRFRLISPANMAMQNQLLNGGFGQADFVSGAQPPAVAFEDSTGKKINNVSLNMTEQTFNGETQSSEYQAVVPARGENAVKLLVTGRKTVAVEVPFTLKDVPLP